MTAAVATSASRASPRPRRRSRTTCSRRCARSTTVDAAVGSIVEEIGGQDPRRATASRSSKNAPTFGFGLDASVPRFNPLELKDGRWPNGPDEVVIDSGTADDEDYAVGDRVRIATLAARRGSSRSSGIAQYPGVESLGGATFAVFDLPTAQQLLDREGKLDAISVAAAAGTTPGGARRRPRAGARRADVEVRTGVEQADEDSGEIATFVSIIRYFLLTFAGIALFVGAFVIFNTLSITVAQRTRELATLRTIGASRRQVLGSVMLEAFVIGALASMIGLFLGLALAKGLNALFKALELDLPTTGLVFSTRTVSSRCSSACVVTLVAGTRARRPRDPRAADLGRARGRDAAARPLARVWPYVAVVLIVLAVLLLGYSLFADDIDIAERLLVDRRRRARALRRRRAALAAARAPARRGSWAGRRGASAAPPAGSRNGNAQRNPGRTAATAAALMIGIALVTFVAVLASGHARLEPRRDRAADPRRPDHHLRGRLHAVRRRRGRRGRRVAGSRRRSPRCARSSAARPAPAATSPASSRTRSLTGYSFDWVEGSDATLGAARHERRSRRRGLRRGRGPLGRRQLRRSRRPATSGRPLVVKGIFEPPPFYPLLGAVTIPKDTFDSLFERRAEPLRVHQRPRRPDGAEQGGDRGGRRRLPRRAGADARRSGSTRRTRSSSSS